MAKHWVADFTITGDGQSVNFSDLTDVVAKSISSFSGIPFVDCFKVSGNRKVWIYDRTTTGFKIGLGAGVLTDAVVINLLITDE